MKKKICWALFLLVTCLFIPNTSEAQEPHLIITDQQNQVDITGSLDVPNSENAYPGLVFESDSVVITNSLSQPVTVIILLVEESNRKEFKLSEIGEIHVKTAQGLVLQNENAIATRGLEILDNSEQRITIGFKLDGDLTTNRFQEKQASLHWQVVAYCSAVTKPVKARPITSHLPKTGEGISQSIQLAGLLILLLVFLSRGFVKYHQAR